MYNGREGVSTCAALPPKAAQVNHKTEIFSGSAMQSDRDRIDAAIERMSLAEPASIQDVVRTAEQGDIRSMIGLADFWYDNRDRVTSLKWMQRAEDTLAGDDAESPIYLASALERGLGAGSYDERKARALRYLERVADAGNVVVMHTLMSYFLYGLNGAPRDRERFRYWASRAAALGSESAKEVLRPGSTVFEDAAPSA
jgi:TPR repeat protein